MLILILIVIVASCPTSYTISPLRPSIANQFSESHGMQSLSKHCHISPPSDRTQKIDSAKIIYLFSRCCFIHPQVNTLALAYAFHIFSHIVKLTCFLICFPTYVPYVFPSVFHILSIVMGGIPPWKAIACQRSAGMPSKMA